MTGRDGPEERPGEHLPLRPTAFHILLGLAGREMHGYAIMKEIEDRTEGEVVLHPGALYRELKRLLETRMIRELEHRPVPADEDDARRRYYGITDFGRQVMAAEAARMSRMVAWTEAVKDPRREGSTG